MNPRTEHFVIEGLSMPTLPAKLVEILVDPAISFPTGSKIYGPASKAADIDYVANVPPHVFDGYTFNPKEEDKYWESDGMSVIYGNLQGEPLNIICISDPKLWRAWRETTDIMRELWLNRTDLHFERKWARVRVFRALVDALWPVRPLNDPMTRAEAIGTRLCMVCGREAINFTYKAAQEYWEATGICERCHNV